MAKEEAADEMQLEGFGAKASVPVSALKFLNGTAGVVVLIAGLIAGAVYHHHITVEAQQKVLDALDANTYVLSLPQAERERLNISMPDSLRRKLKHIRD